VPVRNEASFVARALYHLARQTDLEGNALAGEDYEIIILLNNCSDRSQRVVDAFMGAHRHVRIHAVTRVLPPEKANIGHVRRLLMDEACRRLLGAGRKKGVILSTDADTVVSPTWIEQNRKVLAGGWDGVGGRIVLDPRERELLPADVQRRYLLDIGYNLLRSQLEARLDPVVCDPWPRHHQHFGASLGVTAEAYRNAGGVPDVKHFEDVALWMALFVDGAHLRHSPEITVKTSARMEGRVTAGLSAHLRGFHGSCDPLVESAASLRRRYTARRYFRQAWTYHKEGKHSDGAVDANLRQSAELSGADPETLRLVLEREPTWAGALTKSGIETEVTKPVSGEPCSQPLAEAVPCLRSLLSSFYAARDELRHCHSGGAGSAPRGALPRSESSRRHTDP
jgi:hypothetical protein